MLNNLPAATRIADRALASNKQLAMPVLRGHVHRAAGQRDEALADYHCGAQHPARVPRSAVRPGGDLLRAEPARTVLATLQSLADQFPPGAVPADLQFRQGLALRDSGRHRDAADQFAAAVQLQPHPDVLDQLALGPDATR